jgi:hypothetical protein|nr:MAG TPA: endopeptidase tail [Caudoviricetes sp.]
MYSITYGDDLLYDPLDADAYPVFDVSLSAEINGSGSCEFSITKTHPLYDVIDLYDTDRLVTVTEDSHILFKGYVVSVDEDEYGVRTYSCTGILSFLKKSVVRPYSTDAEDEKHVKAPSTIDGFFNWLISEHDNHTDSRKRFIVGRNEGDIVRRENVIHASSDSASTTANVLQSELLDGLGGYVFVRYGDDGLTYLDYLSECRDTNAQIIDFGVNLVSYSRTDDATDVATVCYAKGGTPEKDEGSDKEKPPVDLTKYPDGPFARGSYRFEKSGDRIICLDLVDKYGYSEMTFEDSDLLDPYELLDSAAIALLKQLEPKVTIDIRAIDLSLFMDGYEPLRCGELVRVRSDPNGFDSYMLVSGMDLDLESPENTEYTLGTTFDAFTGESNKIIRQLNATINKSVDQVTALDQTTKDQAIQIGKVENVANDASDKADNANTTANKAQTTANNAQNTANNASSTAAEAKETADNASLKAAEAKTTADGKNKVFTQTEEPEHTELTNGDLWQKLDSSGHISSVNVWNGTKFTAYSLVADSLLVPGSVNGSVLIKDGTVEAKNIKIGNGEILTELLKARKIVTDDVEAGQFKGYVFTGAIFQSSEAENTGMKLNSTALQMWDSNHNRTVYLDGEGVSNVLTGTFQTGLSGNRVMITPSFKQSEIAGSDKFEGAGIQFYHGTDAYAHPYIAVESTTQQEGEVSALTFNGGRRVQNDPGAFGRIGERKDDAGKKFSVVYFYAQNNYDESVSDNQAGARLILEGHPEGGNTFAALEAYDANGKVGVQADITRGFLYLGGFLRGFTGRATFLASFWKAWWGGSGTGNYSTVTLTYTPAKYGYYRWIVNPAVPVSFATAHTGNDTASSTNVYGYGERGQDVYVSALACLYK